MNKQLPPWHPDSQRSRQTLDDALLRSYEQERECIRTVIDQSISDVQGIANLAGDDVPGLREMIHHLADQLGELLESLK